MAKNIEIRNSTAEFLIFMAEGKEDGVQVVYKDETIWCTQKAMATLFDVGIPAISKHLTHIFNDGELDKNVVISKMEITTQHGAIEGKTQTYPHTSRKELAKIIGITEDGIKKQLANLKKEGMIERIGADYGGHWEVKPKQK